MPRTTRRPDTEALYEQHKAMIWDRAWSFNRRFGADPQEMFSEGNLIFMEATIRWRPSGGAAFGTYLFKALNNGLTNLIMKTSDLHDAGDDDEDDEPAEVPDPTSLERALELRDELRHLDGPTELIITIALEDDTDHTNKRTARGHIISEARARGASWPAIWAGFRGAKELMRR